MKREEMRDARHGYAGAFLAVAVVVMSSSLMAAPAAAPAAEDEEEEEEGVDEAVDAGDFHVVYEPSKKFKPFEEMLKESGLFEETAAALNEVYALPDDIPIKFVECGVANAFYDPDAGEILMCHELMLEEFEAFKQEFDTDEEVGEAVLHSTFFTLFHEMGHALAHQLELPITGKEEDAVDQLAVTVLLEMGEEGEKAALDGAYSFWLATEEGAESADIAFWDEHSLNSQRYYNISCWVYGSNPEKYGYLVTDDELPAERADRCVAEYEQMASSWEALLEPYMKDGASEAEEEAEEEAEPEPPPKAKGGKERLGKSLTGSTH